MQRENTWCKKLIIPLGVNTFFMIITLYIVQQQHNKNTIDDSQILCGEA